MHRKTGAHAPSQQKAQRIVTEIKGHEYIRVFTPVIALTCIIHFRSAEIGGSHLKYLMDWTSTACLCLTPAEHILGKCDCLMRCARQKQIYLYSALWKQSLYIHIFMLDRSRAGDYLFKGTANHFRKLLNIWKWFQSVEIFYTLCK